MDQDRDLFIILQKSQKITKHAIFPLNLGVYLVISNDFKNSEKVSILVHIVSPRLAMDNTILTKLYTLTLTWT